jgi:hypothetical protein
MADFKWLGGAGTPASVAATDKIQLAGSAHTLAPMQIYSFNDKTTQRLAGGTAGDSFPNLKWYDTNGCYVAAEGSETALTSVASTEVTLKIKYWDTSSTQIRNARFDAYGSTTASAPGGGSLDLFAFELTDTDWSYLNFASATTIVGTTAVASTISAARINSIGDDLRFSTGNYMNDAEHMGKSLTLDGSTQYAYRANNEALTIGYDDFMISFWVKQDVNETAYFITTSNGAGYQVITQTNLRLVLIGGGTTESSFTGFTFPAGEWVHVAIIGDRTGNAYAFKNGVWVSTKSISAKDGYNLVNNTNYYLGSNIGANNHLDGQFDKVRPLFKFGTNGLYVTGTPGAGTFEIKIGDTNGDALYDETVIGFADSPVGLIPDMYKSPYESLTNLGYATLDDADRTERHDGSGSVTGLVVDEWYFFDQGTGGHDLSGCATLTADGVFQASQTTGTISSGDASDFIKRIGLVAEYSFNESGTPATLADNTSNGLDLTTSGSPSMSANYMI